MTQPAAPTYEKGTMARAELIHSTIYGLDFTITADHLRLIAEVSLGWYKAVDVDDPDAWDTYLTANGPRFRRPHIETVLALQIICRTGQYRTGRFRRASIFDRWRPAVSAADSRHFGTCYNCEQHIGAGRLAGLSPVDGPAGADGPVWCGQSTCPPMPL